MAAKAVAGEPVTVDGRKYRAVREGLAQILAPYRDGTAPNNAANPGNKPHNNDEGDQAVFYNPIQQYNRDLSVLAILTFGESALVEKEVKYAKKQNGRKGRNSTKKAKRESDVQAKSAPEVESSRKRKADEIDGVDDSEVVTGENGAKKVRVEAGDDEAVDALEVQQLEAEPEITIVTDEPEASGMIEQVNEAKSANSEKKQLPFTILDALSASGLRAIRYAKEIPFATNVVANDLSAEAVKAIETNIDHNQLRGKVHSNVGDARTYMYSKTGNEHRNPPAGYVHKFDVVDLDPYGTAAPFFDAAIQALADGGLLCVTCTDAGVFASNGYPEKAYALYGGLTMKGPFSHEAGLRLILHAVATSAAKYSVAIEPLLSLSIDFYARLFIRIHKQQQQVKVLAGTTMITYNCDNGCYAWKTQPLARFQEKLDRVGDVIFKHGYAQGPSTTPHCEHCGSKMHLAGPMWSGPLHNPDFIQRILDKLPTVDKTTYQTTERMKGMLTLALEEDLTLATSNTTSNPESKAAPAPTDARIIPRMPPQTIDATPFFFLPGHIAGVLHCPTPPEDQLRGALRHLGFQVTRSHCKAGSVKTNAPWEVVWEVMREWVRQHAPVKEGKVTKNMPGWRIMQKLRGSDAKITMDVHESIRKALEKGVDGKDELRSLLESGLYRLEHPKAQVENGGDQADQNIQEPGVEPANGVSSKPVFNQPQDVSKLKVVFDAALGKEKPRGKLVRYQINPRANWGPMNKAGG